MRFFKYILLYILYLIQFVFWIKGLIIRFIGFIFWTFEVILFSPLHAYRTIKLYRAIKYHDQTMANVRTKVTFKADGYEIKYKKFGPLTFRKFIRVIAGEKE